MLARAALKTANGRALPSTVRPWTYPSLSVAIRTYASDEKPHRAPPKSTPFTKSPKPEISGTTSRGPVPNRTWSPDKPIVFASSDPAPSRTISKIDPIPDTPDHVGRAQEEATKSAPSSLPRTQPSLHATAPTAAAPTPRRSSKISPEAQTADPTRLQPEVIEAFEAIDKQSTKQRTQDGTPASSMNGSLPDLRQGIPSTFVQEFSDRSSSFKDQDSTPPSLDITGDPAVASGGGRGSDELPKEKYVSSIDRRRNTIARAVTIAFFAFALTGTLFMGQNWDNKAEEALYPEAPNGWSATAVYNRIKVRLSRTLGYYTEPAFPKLLPEVDPNMRPPYTLVLSLEDLLVSSKWDRVKGWQVAKRPGVDYFLRYLSQYYELVIFTSVQMMNADPIIRKLDPYRIVMWPLFREATRYMNGEHVKDLSYLNRDLTKTLVVDTVAAHTQLQPENAIILPKWHGDIKDHHGADLVALIPFLEYIATMSIEDVRKVLKSYDGTHIPTEFAVRESKAREQFNRQLESDRARRPRSGFGSLSSALGFKPTLPTGQPAGPGELSSQGKMLSDQMREQGRRNYEQLEKEIRENGAKWLEEMANEEKKAQEEQVKSMQSGVFGVFGSRST